jgi:hypothetical protein
MVDLVGEDVRRIVMTRQWIEEFIRDLVIYQRDHFGWQIDPSSH